jgi:hypothetical protein
MHAVIYGHTHTQYMCTNDLQTTTTHDRYIHERSHMIPSRKAHLAVILDNQLYKVVTILHSHFYKGTEVKQDTF